MSARSEALAGGRVTLVIQRKRTRGRTAAPEPDHESLDFVWSVWIHMTPAERLRRSWALRKRLPDPQAVHDAKLFPKP